MKAFAQYWLPTESPALERNLEHLDMLGWRFLAFVTDPAPVESRYIQQRRALFERTLPEG